MVAVCSLAVVFAGCSKSTEEDNNSEYTTVVGEWCLDAWNDELVTDFSIYLKLDETGRFELYQQLEHGYYEQFDGKYSVADGVLTGVYDDGEPWDVYNYTLENGGARLILTAQTGGLRSVYVRSTIPSDIVVKRVANSRASSLRRIF